MVDLDGDGRRDVISGSYWPGDLFIFREQEDGTYAKGETIVSMSGENVNAGPKWESERSPQMDSLAAAPHAADLDGDGDLDLLIGNISGRVILVPNRGTATNPKFVNEQRSAVEAAGEPIVVPGGDSGPFVVDWDHDGDLDLLVGAGDGSVWLYDNEGTRTAPRFAAGAAIVPASSYGYDQDAPMQGDMLRSHGTRTKVCATDLDGDGWEDLLIGDFLSIDRPEPELTEAQIARRGELREGREELFGRMNEHVTKLQEDGEQPDFENDAVLTELSEKIDELMAELAELEGGSDPHGFVWSLRRVPPRDAVAAH